MRRWLEEPVDDDGGARPWDDIRRSFASSALFDEAFGAACSDVFAASERAAEGEQPRLAFTGLLEEPQERHWAHYCRVASQQDINVAAAVVFLQDAVEGRYCLWQLKRLELYQMYCGVAMRSWRCIAILANLFLGAYGAVNASNHVAWHLVTMLPAVLLLLDLVFLMCITGPLCLSRLQAFHLCCAALFVATAVYCPPPLRLVHSLCQPLTSLGYCSRVCKVLSSAASSAYRLISVLLLIAVMLLGAALLACFCFSATNLHFHSVTSAMYTLAVAMTTVNFPDIMLPAYHQTYAVVKTTGTPVSALGHTTYDVHFDIHPLSATGTEAGAASLARHSTPLFFMAFMAFVICFLMNIVFAVIFDFYKRQLTRDVYAAHTHRQWMLKCAWYSLTSPQQPSVAPHVWADLLSRLDRHIDAAQVEVLFKVLNESQTGLLSFQEFHGVFQLLNLRITVAQESPPWAARLPPAVRTRWAVQWLLCLAGWSAFPVLMDVVSVLAAGFGVLHVEVLSRGDVWRLTPQQMSLMTWLEIGLGIPLDLELLFWLFSIGWTRYWATRWNRIGLILTIHHLLLYSWLLVLLAVGRPPTEALCRTEVPVTGQQLCLLFRVILLLRLLRCTRLLTTFAPYKLTIKTLSNVLPLFLPYFGALAAAMYLCAVAGCHFFQGQHHRVDPQSDFAQGNYYSLNFDTVYHAFVTTFALVVVNNWHVVMEGYVSAVGPAARLFFFGLYIVLVMVMLNVIAALVVEVFASQYKLNLHHKLSPVHNRFALRIVHLYCSSDAYREKGPAWEVSYKRYDLRAQAALDSMYMKEEHVLPWDAAMELPRSLPLSLGHHSTVLSSRLCPLPAAPPGYGAVDPAGPWPAPEGPA
eukprot:EG_transcript_2822